MYTATKESKLLVIRNACYSLLCCLLFFPFFATAQSHPLSEVSHLSSATLWEVANTEQEAAPAGSRSFLKKFRNTAFARYWGKYMPSSFSNPAHPSAKSPLTSDWFDLWVTVISTFFFSLFTFFVALKRGMQKKG